MAAKKKSTKAKPAPAKKSAPAKKKPAVRLTQGGRAQLMRPREGFVEMIRDAVEAWESDGGKELRVTGLTPAKLRSLARVAESASDREEKFRRALEDKLAPLVDARMIAHDAAWTGLLELHGAVRSLKNKTRISETFAFVAEYFTPRTKKDDAPAPPPADA